MKRDEYIILRALKDAPEELKSMTVGEYVQTLAERAKKEQEEIDKDNNSICKEFKGAYLRIHLKDGTFGPETKYIHITNIKPGSLTTEYERLFDLEGKKLSFSNSIGTTLRDMKSGDVYDSLSGKSLKTAERITKEEFDEAIDNFRKIEMLTNSMI